jgi:hypothetical protein
MPFFAFISGFMFIPVFFFLLCPSIFFELPVGDVLVAGGDMAIIARQM